MNEVNVVASTIPAHPTLMEAMPKASEMPESHESYLLVSGKRDVI